MIGIDANEPFPVICPASPCPATYPVATAAGPGGNPPATPGFPPGLAGQPVPAGSFFVPTTTKANPTLNNTWTWFSRGDSSYNALQVDVNRRFSAGLTLRGVYTFSKVLDDGDSSTRQRREAVRRWLPIHSICTPIGDWVLSTCGTSR